MPPHQKMVKVNKLGFGKSVCGTLREDSPPHLVLMHKTLVNRNGASWQLMEEPESLA